MTRSLLENQFTQRQRYLETILASDNPRKLIVAGPGTGKTYTFSKVFETLGSVNNLALTFIRKLVADMESEFGDIAEVRTFHAYCKMLLHKAYGGFLLSPFLTQVVNEDSQSLGRYLSHFDQAFQILSDDSEEINFYLMRGDYYDAVSFNDSVYRVLQIAKQETHFLPAYDQIVIDEFQDFNPLEVAFIDELQRKSPTLIVGDDDQAVYSQRNSSPEYIRAKFVSGDYETFELPYCSRCPRAVVDAISSFIDAIVAAGGFPNRIDRPFVPFLEGKEYENTAYPKIISANASTIACMAKLVVNGIEKIPAEDIAESYKEGYPCVLIVGQRQYLNPLNKRLAKKYNNVAFTQAHGREYVIADGYEILRSDAYSNLGWRLLAGCELPPGDLGDLIERSLDGTPFVNLLASAFIERHESNMEILGKENLNDVDVGMLRENLGDEAEDVISRFFGEEEEVSEPDESQPSIMLSSFEGCKGLSAGHVFIVGLNDSVMPQIDPADEISDIEISKFIVAMTRTRKLLYLFSNWSDYGPRSAKYTPSMFIRMIPEEFRYDMGFVKSEDAEDLIAAAFTAF
jgi:superfamily I DNA/RNA helicase